MATHIYIHLYHFVELIIMINDRHQLGFYGTKTKLSFRTKIKNV